MSHDNAFDIPVLHDGCSAERGAKPREENQKSCHNEWCSFRTGQHYLIAVGDSVERLAIQPAFFMPRRMVNSIVGKGTESLISLINNHKAIIKKKSKLSRKFLEI